MANHMTTRDEQERNVPIHNNNQHGDMRSLISHFWNMLDFSPTAAIWLTWSLKSRFRKTRMK